MEMIEMLRSDQTMILVRVGSVPNGRDSIRYGSEKT